MKVQIMKVLTVYRNLPKILMKTCGLQPPPPSTPSIAYLPPFNNAILRMSNPPGRNDACAGRSDACVQHAMREDVDYCHGKVQDPENRRKNIYSKYYRQKLLFTNGKAAGFLNYSCI